MGTQKQLEDALAQIDLLEKKLSECCKKESKLLKIIGTLDSQIFNCIKNSDGEYTPVFSEGKIANKYNFKTEQIKGKTIRELMGDEPFARLKPYYDRAFSGETAEFSGFMFEGRYFSQTLVPLTKNEEGEVTEVIGINHDITDRLQSEIENRKNIDILNRIIEHNPYSIQILNAEGYHIRENKAFLKLFKSIPDEKWSILQDPQIKESGLGKLLQHVIEGEVVKTPPVWFNAHFVDPKYPDHLVCIGSVIFPVFLSNGKLEFIVLMHEDITISKVAKEKLKKSEQRLRHLLSSNPAVIYTSKVVPPYDWTFISDNVSSLTGFASKDYLANQNFWSDHVHPDDRQKVMDELPMVPEKGAHIMEYRFQCKNGRVIWILDETKVIYDSRGNPLEMIGYWIDISERKRAEETFLKLSSAVEQTADSIMITDRNGTIEYVNHAFEVLTGYASKEAVGKTPRILKSGIKDQEYYERLWKIILSGKVFKEEVVNKKKNGDLYDEEKTISPIFDKNKIITHFVGTGVNISKRKIAERELIEAKEHAEESDRLKSAFLANMSHEVRTPLNGIIGFSELLADPDFDEEQKSEFIQSIIASGNNLLTIISDIMDFSRMESGEITIRSSLINVQKLISIIKEQFAIQVEGKKLELNLTHPDHYEETAVFADAERLKQIFNNLMSNAIKFTMNGSIEIGFQPKGKMVEFYVKDTGIGIPAEFHDTIFERFMQVEAGNSRKYGGNGLGLAISKKLVELMGGKIWVVSESGVGSVFYFTLPIF